jgi:hypothetical protein
MNMKSQGMFPTFVYLDQRFLNPQLKVQKEELMEESLDFILDNITWRALRNILWRAIC